MSEQTTTHYLQIVIKGNPTDLFELQRALFERSEDIGLFISKFEIRPLNSNEK